MKQIFVLWLSLVAGGLLCAQEKSGKAGTAPPAPSSAIPAAALAQAEPFMLLPEPREMRVGHSVVLGEAKSTVFTPARRLAGSASVQPYSKAEFAKLGISADTFAEKAREAADRLLATVQPELMKDDAGRVRYAVYRGEEPLYACLLAAPSLARVFQNIFGKEVWVAAPDRNALYVFPPNPAIVSDFAGDLQERFETDAFAASEEVFIIRDTGEMKATASFRGK